MNRAFVNRLISLSLAGCLAMGCSRYEETLLYDGENRFSVSFASRAVTDLSATQTEAVYAGMRFAAYRQSSGTFSHAVILTKENTGSATVYKGMMRTGADWGLVAVSPGSSLTLPGAGASMASTVMYEMPEDLQTCPEIFSTAWLCRRSSRIRTRGSICRLRATCRRSTYVSPTSTVS